MNLIALIICNSLGVSMIHLLVYKWELDRYIQGRFNWNYCELCTSFWLSWITALILIIHAGTWWGGEFGKVALIPFLSPPLIYMIIGAGGGR